MMVALEAIIMTAALYALSFEYVIHTLDRLSNAP